MRRLFFAMLWWLCTWGAVDVIRFLYAHGQLESVLGLLMIASMLGSLSLGFRDFLLAFTPKEPTQ